MEEKKGKILIVDDDVNLLEVLKLRLQFHGYETNVAESPKEALRKIGRESFDLMVVDLMLPEMNGIELMEQIFSEIGFQLPVIILTAYGTINLAVEAIQKGAYSFLTKPFEHHDLILHIEKALEKNRLSSQIENLQKILSERATGLNLVGKSQSFQRVLREAMGVANTDSTVLLTGETGTGKELIAQTIHNLSDRFKNPFVPINCGAIPETLLESELFGHSKGAFTGAHRKKVGLFARANGGTIFLDEIGEAPQSVQVKLLRAIETKEVIPLGTTIPQKVDVRVITATNKDLMKEVEEGNFRKDLYFRINVIPIHLPPLRERVEDIPLLVQYFLTKFQGDGSSGLKGILPSTMSMMLEYDWPGNIRELENRIERALIFSKGSSIAPADMFPEKFETSGQEEEVDEEFDTITDYSTAKASFEKRYIISLMHKCKGNISQVARIAGRHRPEIYKMIRKYKINPRDFKSSE